MDYGVRPGDGARGDALAGVGADVWIEPGVTDAVGSMAGRFGALATLYFYFEIVP